MLTWLLVVPDKGMSLVRVPRCSGMAQGRGSFHGVGNALGLGTEHSWGLCVSPQDKPPALSM